jgi:hypothetical protein
VGLKKQLHFLILTKLLIMRTLILNLLFFVSLPILSQKNVNMEFCEYLINQNSLNIKINFDTTNVKTLIDTLKKYVIEKKQLELPTNCSTYNLNLSDDLNDYMICFTGSFLNMGTLLYYHFPIEGEFDKNLAYSKFDEYIKNNYNLDFLPYTRVYCDIFEFENENITTIYNPNDFTETKIKETTNNYFIFFISYL